MPHTTDSQPETTVILNPNSPSLYTGDTFPNKNQRPTTEEESLISFNDTPRRHLRTLVVRTAHEHSRVCTRRRSRLLIHHCYCHFFDRTMFLDTSFSLVFCSIHFETEVINYGSFHSSKWHDRHLGRHIDRNRAPVPKSVPDPCLSQYLGSSVTWEKGENIYVRVVPYF